MWNSPPPWIQPAEKLHGPLYSASAGIPEERVSPARGRTPLDCGARPPPPHAQPPGLPLVPAAASPVLGRPELRRDAQTGRDTWGKPAESSCSPSHEGPREGPEGNERRRILSYRVGGREEKADEGSGSRLTREVDLFENRVLPRLVKIQQERKCKEKPPSVASWR